MKKTVGGSKPTATAMKPNRTAKAAPAPAPAPAEEQEVGDAAESKAAAWEEAKPQGAVDPGKYYAVIEEFLVQEEDEKGQSARIKYGVANEGEFRGVQVTQFYKLFEAGSTDDKPITGKGAAYLKKDLAVLGYGDVAFDDLEDAMNEIVEKNTGVIITVKQNGQWTNVYLAGLAEDGEDVIAEYLDQRTF